jgi:2-aminoadipate transaminase
LVRDYSSSCKAMVRAVRAAVPDLHLVSEPRGGFFSWVLLPENVSATALLPVAERHGVVFLPGRACAPSCPPEAFDRHARLCFAMEEPAQIEEGVRRLAAAVMEARTAAA